VRLSAEIHYDADPAAVVAMLTDRAFQERKCAATGALESEVEIEPSPNGAVAIHTVRNLPTDHVPDYAKIFVGGSLVVVQVDRWGPPRADGARDGTIVVEVKGIPVRFHGTMTLRPERGGAAEALDGDIKAAVPVVGARIERALEPAIRAAIRVEQREGIAWLAGG